MKVIEVKTKEKKKEQRGRVMKLVLDAKNTLFSRPLNLAVSFVFPAAAALILIAFAGKDMFVHCEGTQAACFIMVCAAIWGGLFNSIEVIVGERDVIRRKYFGGLIKLNEYMIAQAIVQFILCLVQTAVLCLGIYFCGQELPETGIAMSSPMAEYYITLFLTMYASDTLGLLLSAFVRKTDAAIKIAPYVLLFEIVFSGFLFELEGAADLLSRLMISRHSMAALGITCDVNAIPLQMHVLIPQTVGVIKHAEQEMFIATAQNLYQAWLGLTVTAVICVVLACVVLRRVKNDPRG